MLFLVFLLAGCQSSEQVINNAVNDLNNVCPITIPNRGNIFKVEYINNEIVFYTNLHYSLAQGEHSFSELKMLERNDNAIKAVMQICLNDPYTIGAFKDITMSMAEEVDLKIKVISKDERNNMELIVILPWREVPLVTPYILRK